MHDQNGFNPRKCNSANTPTGSIERDISNVVVALPISNETVDFLEQTTERGSNLVNTRLAFDTEIVLPILISNNEEEKTD